MLLIKHFSILFVFLLVSTTTDTVDRPAELSEANFVSSIVDDAFNAEVLEAFEDIYSIDNVQLYKRTDAYVYQINGTDTDGKTTTNYAIISINDIGKFNPKTTLACGCTRNSKYWTKSGLTRVCEKYCLEMPPIEF